MAAKILVVDDDPDLVRLIESRLKTQRYEVFIAYDGKMCLELALRQPLDLIILDVMMPGMDGFEVLHTLRRTAETSSIPVIMLTQKRESGSMLDAQQLGAIDYLSKPFDSQELLRIIKRYV